MYKQARTTPATSTADAGARDIPEGRIQDAIRHGQSWLDAHEERFQLIPRCRDEKQFETRFKPLVELSLLSYVLTRDRHRAAGAQWAVWGRSMAERLFPHVEWEGFMEAFRLQTSATLGLAIYPYLTLASGRPTRFTAEARALLEDAFARVQERTPMRDMDFQFTRHLMGTPLSADEIRQQVERTVLRAPLDTVSMDTEALYDLTHVVFFATQFGCVPWVAPSEETGIWLDRDLESMTLARFLMADADLGAELLLVQFYAAGRFGRLTTRCLDLLLDAQLPSGAFVRPPGGPPDLDEFDAHYHTTLVAIAALAEAVCLARAGAPLSSL